MEKEADTGNSERLKREKDHARALIQKNFRSWGWQTPAGQIRYRRRLDFLCGVHSKPNIRIMEIGAGTGTYSIGLSKKFKNFIAIDISRDLIEKARSQNTGVQFEVMDAHNLTIPDNTLDAIVGCSVLHHLDWDKALHSMFNKLKSGGVIRFSEPNLLNPQIFFQKRIPFLKQIAGDSPDETAFTAHEIRVSLFKSGFSNIRVESYEFLHPKIPKKCIKIVMQIEKVLEQIPLRAFAGSLLIEATKRK